MYGYRDIRVVHLEITDKCNAACPMCPRNIRGGAVNPYLPLVELTLGDIKSMFPVEFVRQLRRLFMCGNYGDPIVAKDTLAIFRWLRQVNPGIRLGMNTNASARNPNWWGDLATLFRTEWSAVTFSLDGLADTNHIYRRHTNWDRIMGNVRAFIGAGGNAAWDFIVFRHNEHQVEEARRLAKELGFIRFNLKRSSRFYDSEKLGEVRKSLQVLDGNGKAQYRIFQPNDPKFRNVRFSEAPRIVKKYGTVDRFYDETPVSCKVLPEGSLYVSAEGLVFPCCWTAGQLYPTYREGLDLTSIPIRRILKRIGGKNAINAKRTDLRSIVEGPFFQRIERSWTKRSIVAGKLRICAKTCGTLDVAQAQHERQSL